MKKEKITESNNILDDVIKTSQVIRNFMMDRKIPFNERSNELKTMRTAVEANKNIVSAVITELNLEKLCK